MAAFDALPDLLLREEWRPLPATAPADPLVAAAAALGAGEARRAAALLDATAFADADEQAVAAALRNVAGMLAANWFPGSGGAVQDPDDPADLAQPNLPAAAVDAALVVTLARQVVAAAPILRSILQAGFRDGNLAVASHLDEVEELRSRLAATQPRAAGPAALLLLDLYGRFGAPPPDGLLDRARAAYAADPVGSVVCDLVDLDARVFHGHAETLGEDLEREGVTLPALDAGPAAAYAALADRFAAAGAERGVAVVALRLAQFARAGGDGDGAREHLHAVATVAAAAGDTALVSLVTVHTALLAIELGDDVDVAAVAGPVVEWASTVGSRSFGRGLARLALRRAQRLRGELRAGTQALDLARMLARGLAAGREQQLVDDEEAVQLGAASLRQGSLEVQLADLIDTRATAGAPPATGGDVEWVGLLQQGISVLTLAEALPDADILTTVDDQLRWIADRYPQAPAFPDLIEPGRQALRDALAGLPVTISVKIGTHARDLDVDEEAPTAAFAAAFEAAELSGSALDRARVLGAARRFAEAATVLDAIAATLEPAMAAQCYARLARRFDLARPLLQSAAPADNWADAALRAEVALGVGDHQSAAAESALAIDRFQAELFDIASDLLRTSRLDSPDVAGLYTTAVRIHAAREPTPTQLDLAFRLSDRARGMTLTDLIDAESDATTEAERAAVRIWQRAGADMAHTIEQVRAQSPGAMPTRFRIDAALRTLLGAESRLRAIAPTLYAQRLSLPPELGVAEVQQRLAPGALLLEYHAFDDQLVTFALSRDSAGVRTARLPTAELSGKVHRYHAMVSSRLSATADWEQYGADLAAALLDPVAAELADHDRVIVVPFGSLAMLPFHSLPFAGGDLGGQRVVSYLPAASAMLGRLEPTVATGPPLVLGGLDYPLDGDLKPLPGTGVEARRIAELYGVEPLVGPAADRETVLGRLVEARVAHFATHGKLVEAAPYSSYLALSNGEQLTVPDLVGLGLRTELAVLSACESGRGDATATGDVIGLTRALLGSGVRGLVVSLWPVDDAYACLLMAAFHEQLQALPAAAALAAAVAALRVLSPDEALARYVALGGAPGDMVPGSGTVRGPQVEDDGEPEPAAELAGSWHPAVWAPFVYVGLP